MTFCPTCARTTALSGFGRCTLCGTVVQEGATPSPPLAWHGPAGLLGLALAALGIWLMATRPAPPVDGLVTLAGMLLMAIAIRRGIALGQVRPTLAAPFLSREERIADAIDRNVP